MGMGYKNSINQVPRAKMGANKNPISQEGMVKMADTSQKTSINRSITKEVGFMRPVMKMTVDRMVVYVKTMQGNSIQFNEMEFVS